MAMDFVCHFVLLTCDTFSLFFNWANEFTSNNKTKVFLFPNILEVVNKAYTVFPLHDNLPVAIYVLL